MTEQDKAQAPHGLKAPPGTCIPWEAKRAQIAEISGDEELIRKVWEDVDALGYMYIWQVLLSF